jgi:archaellum component FlaG (FlaF/FlaG flagellin family)
MAIPTLRAHKFKGSGSAQVYDILTGTTLGSQVGANFSTLETASNIFMRPGCTYCEFLGKEYVIQGNTVRERNQGGTGVWGAIYTNVQAGPTNAHSGLHIIHPNGVPTMVYGYTRTSGGNPYAVSTIDGINFNEILIASANLNTSSNSTGTTYRDALVWCGGGNVTGGTGQSAYFDFSTLTGVVTLTGGSAYTGGVHTDLCVASNNLFLVRIPNQTATTQWDVLRWGGSSWTGFGATLTGAQIDNVPNIGGGPCLFEDPATGDLVAIVPGQNPSSQVGEFFFRIEDLTDTATVTDISATVLQAKYRPTGGSGSAGAQWYSMVDNDTDPTTPIVYLFRSPGNGLNGTYRVFQWNGFGGLISNPVTASTTDGATSISTDFSICNFKDGIGERIPTVLASPTGQGARAELGVSAILLTHGAVTSGPFNLNETITGAGGATATLLIDNTGSLVVFATNSTAFINGEVITGTGGAFATLSAGPSNTSAPPTEVGGGTKRYFQVYGDTPSTVSIRLYVNATEGAPDVQGTIVSVTSESGTPATTPSVTGNAIINLTPDLGVGLWSLVHNATADGFVVGDVYEVALKAT